MTDNEIKKALEICSNDGGCCDCPYVSNIACIGIISKNALDLINRQQAEIERLNDCVNSEDEIRAIMKSQMAPMVKEIVNEQIDVAMKVARAEAIKDFAERLKKDFGHGVLGMDSVSAIIDNLVQEMVGDG